MSKYSEHVTILVKDSGLVFQAVNDSKSAFCEVIFAKQFFATYSFSGSFECRVDIKSLILVFRIINLGSSHLFFLIQKLIVFFLRSNRGELQDCNGLIITKDCFRNEVQIWCL